MNTQTFKLADYIIENLDHKCSIYSPVKQEELYNYLIVHYSSVIQYLLISH